MQNNVRVLTVVAVITCITQVTSAKNILGNAGCEEGSDSPVGWSRGQAVAGVEYIWDKNAGYNSQASLCLSKSAERYFPIAEWFQTIDKAGESPKIQVSAQVKADNVFKAILDVLFLDEKGEWILHKWVSYVGSKEPGEPPANHDWKEYSGEIDIPEGTARIQIGLQMYGPGRVWFDDVKAAYIE